jgi:hypothetical protein
MPKWYGLQGLIIINTQLHVVLVVYRLVWVLVGSCTLVADDSCAMTGNTHALPKWCDMPQHELPLLASPAAVTPD